MTVLRSEGGDETVSAPLPQDTEAAEGRALVVIDEEIGGRELTRSLADHLGDGIAEIFVVAPAVQSTSPGAERGLDSRGPYFLPKSTGRDTLSIIVGVIGTGVLIVLAALAMGNHPSRVGNHEEGRLGADVVAMMLLAGGFFLINVGNIIGMVLFQGIRFQGLPARFFAWTTPATPPAVAASVVLLIAGSH